MRRRRPGAPSQMGQRLAAQGLEPAVLETVGQLPPASQHAMLRWLDDTVRRLERGRGGEDQAAPAAGFQAVDAAVQRERSRIARELHDGLAADLATCVALFKHYLETAPQGRAGDEVLEDILQILEGLLQNTRTTLRSMRPPPLGAAGLVPELRRTADEYGRLHGIRVELWTNGSEADLSQAQREAAFHIVREALTNVRRHSSSRVARVRLDFAARPFLIEVADEGRGFDTAAPTPGYGLVGMRERAAGIGSRLEVVTSDARGTHVYLFGPDPRVG